MMPLVINNHKSSVLFCVSSPPNLHLKGAEAQNLQKRDYCKSYSCLCASGTCPSANLTLVRKQNKYKKRILQPGTAEPGHWRFSRQTPHRGGEGEGRGGRIKRTGSESHFNRPHTIWAPTELSLPDRFLFIPYQCLPTASFLSFTL